MTLLAAHAAATWFMVGLIWTIQAVHYPLFARVGAAEFVAYERSHTTRMGRLLVAPAGAEVILAAALVLARPAGVSPTVVWIGGGLLAAAWVITALVHVPLHGRLSSGRDDRDLGRLVRTNWWRTGLWTVRGALAASLLVQAGAA